MTNRTSGAGGTGNQLRDKEISVEIGCKENGHYRGCEEQFRTGYGWAAFLATLHPTTEQVKESLPPSIAHAAVEVFAEGPPRASAPPAIDFNQTSLYPGLYQTHIAGGDHEDRNWFV